MMHSSSTIYLLKDLSRASGHSVHTLKFYLKLGLIREAGRSPQIRFRYFDEETIARLSRIRSWRRERKSLAEIRQLLNGQQGFATQPSSPIVAASESSASQYD